MNILIYLQSAVAAWQIPPSGVERLRARFPQHTFVHATDKEARARGLADCEVAYTWLLTAEELAAAPKLRWVHSSAVAVETLCLGDLAARGVRVSNTREVQAGPIAEHVLACVLAFSKQLPLVLERQREARWSQNEFTGARLPWMLKGRTLGLIGAGTIGREIARLASAFGMHVIAMRRTASPVEGLARVVGGDALPELLRESDVLVIAAPQTAETENLIGARELSQMKPGALLVNVGRAKIVDTDALVAALQGGHLGGAALDVFPREPLPSDHPLWTCPNVILTPHTSGFRAGHWDEVVDLFAENIRRFERGAPLLYEVRPELGY